VVLSMPESDRYVIRGGQAGYDRLLVLSRERWPDTRAFFERAGVAPGMKCLDVGCGGGFVTLELARMVQPGGTATGIDMDPVVLELARRAAAQQGLTNVDFVHRLVQDWSSRPEYDVVCSRFLLQHVPDPRSLIRAMWNAVRPGGVLMAEDTDWMGWSTDPPRPAMDFLRDRYLTLLERRGGDGRIGLKLRRYFHEEGIPSPETTLVAPLRLDSDRKSIAWLTIDATADAFIKEGLASREELDSIASSLREMAADPRAIVTGPKTFQVWARKPAS
jgi:ubiquinone/menaquinone biosynthesis C-methylase UbiE